MGAMHIPPLGGCLRVEVTASRQSYLAILADWCKVPLHRYTIVGAPAYSRLWALPTIQRHWIFSTTKAGYKPMLRPRAGHAFAFCPALRCARKREQAPRLSAVLAQAGSPYASRLPGRGQVKLQAGRACPRIGTMNFWSVAALPCLPVGRWPLSACAGHGRQAPLPF
jgi:hypothetical protein